MRILFVSEFLPKPGMQIFTGGVETKTAYLSDYLRKKGHSIFTECRTSSYDFNSFWCHIKRMVFLCQQVAKIIFTNEKFDIVEGENMLTYPIAFLWAKRTGARAVAWVPDLFETDATTLLGPLTGFLTMIAEMISGSLPWDGIIALSKQTKKKIDIAGWSTKSSDAIYGGVKTTSDKNRASRTNKKFDKPTMLTISRLVSYKRIQDAILAVYLLKTFVPDIQLLIVGEGPQKRKLQHLVTNCALQPNVRFLGRVSEQEKWELLSQSHIHVLPSVFEGFGLVTIEALASGTPVVASDIPVHREILRGDEGGILFPSKDYVALSHAMHRLLRDETFYNRKTAEGLKLAAQYDWDTTNEKTEHFYQRLLSH